MAEGEEHIAAGELKNAYGWGASEHAAGGWWQQPAAPQRLLRDRWPAAGCCLQHCAAPQQVIGDCWLTCVCQP